MPETRFPRAAAVLIALFIECIFYGIYLVTVVTALRRVLRCSTDRPWKSQVKSQRWTLTVLFLMFAVSTLNIVLGLVRILQGLVYNIRVGDAADEQLGRNWLNMVKGLTLCSQILIADVVLIYRCWIIHGKSRRVVLFPILMWWGALACVIVSMYLQVASFSKSAIDISALVPVSTFAWLTTLALNVYANTMIVFRIRRVVNRDDLATEKRSPLFRPLENIMRIIIESGLLYSITCTIFFITLAAGSNALFLTAAMEVQVVGIAFNLILIRARNSARMDTTLHDSGKHRLVICAPEDAKVDDAMNIVAPREIPSRHSC
ncbi:hypothetical protein LshimejAT787_1101710 [Lyophyllum shimeji]|uniref:Uncharacterized protein n=1 Tax=Lyophyllum shimeji TaxID=47721 RepID=A0A9P3PUZ4_LYOSH|nr:hypothetical protein LshimejAT787_1101710 [Lyophyllum shimeji]